MITSVIFSFLPFNSWLLYNRDLRIYAESFEIIRTLPEITTLAGTFTTVFSLEMHCMLNGKNYEWLFGKLTG